MRIYYDDDGEITGIEEFRRGKDGKDDPAPGVHIVADFDYRKENQLDYRVVDGKLTKKPRADVDARVAAEAAKVEIRERKQYLASTDYVAIKIAEGAATAEDYAEVITKRREAREKINVLSEPGEAI